MYIGSRPDLNLVPPARNRSDLSAPHASSIRLLRAVAVRGQARKRRVMPQVLALENVVQSALVKPTAIRPVVGADAQDSLPSSPDIGRHRSSAHQGPGHP